MTHCDREPPFWRVQLGRGGGAGSCCQAEMLVVDGTDSNNDNGDLSRVRTRFQAVSPVFILQVRKRRLREAKSLV